MNVRTVGSSSTTSTLARGAAPDRPAAPKAAATGAGSAPEYRQRGSNMHTLVPFPGSLSSRSSPPDCRTKP